MQTRRKMMIFSYFLLTLFLCKFRISASPLSVTKNEISTYFQGNFFGNIGLTWSFCWVNANFSFKYYIWAISIIFIHLFLHFHLYIFLYFDLLWNTNVAFGGKPSYSDAALMWVKPELRLFIHINEQLLPQSIVWNVDQIIIIKECWDINSKTLTIFLFPNFIHIPFFSNSPFSP